MARKRQVVTSSRKFYRQAWFKWAIGSLLGLIVIILLVFRFSPWPGALVIKTVFEKNAGSVRVAMEKHTPSVPITSMKNVAYREGDADAVLDVYYPRSIENTKQLLPVVIWTHGGAWLSGSKDEDAPYFKLLAAKGYVVVAPNYTLAPARSYPYQIHQLNDAHRYILSQATQLHIDTSKVVLAGDSAGAQISSQFGALVTNPTYAREVGITPALSATQLKGLILNCGIYDMAGLTHPDPILPKIVGWGNDVTVWSYAGTRDFSDPVIRQMSPYHHVTRDFPPTYISGGNGDLLTNAQSKLLVTRLQSLNVKVTTLFYSQEHQPALPHEYQFNLDTPEGQQALKATTEFLTALFT